MTTKDLISKMAASMGHTKRHTEELMDTFVAIMKDHLDQHDSVQLQGLGSLEVRKKAPRIIVHPKTGKRSMTEGKNQIYFKPTSQVKEALK